MGVIQDTTGDVIFEVMVDIIAFKPHENEILDGVVHSVSKEGIEVKSGPIRCLIKNDRMSNCYSYDSTLD